ncbi:unnamed protein product [Cylicocyclus nassatus]|uniref:PB1 domain-containing protein n=1 Tax=Cylicocyclus nassatus TaxID=53992 RepID=A0AA36M1Z3_CYLNA|nr:unnamed protein product [Cylicocyclus nassatus]
MTDEENSISFKFHVEPTPLLEFKYKNKDDLYAKFLKKAKRLGFPVDGVFYCADYDGDIVVVRNADDFFAAIDHNYSAKAYFPCPPRLDLRCTDSDKEECEVTDKTKGKRASKKSSDFESHHYPVPWGYKTYMDSDHRPYFDSRCYTMEPRCHSHRHCSCERLTKDFEKL